MEDDGGLSSIEARREAIKGLVEGCTDFALLDLVYKLLLNA